MFIHELVVTAWLGSQQSYSSNTAGNQAVPPAKGDPPGLDVPRFQRDELQAPHLGWQVTSGLAII